MQSPPETMHLASTCLLPKVSSMSSKCRPNPKRLNRSVPALSECACRNRFQLDDVQCELLSLRRSSPLKPSFKKQCTSTHTDCFASWSHDYAFWIMLQRMPSLHFLESNTGRAGACWLIVLGVYSESGLLCVLVLQDRPGLSGSAALSEGFEQTENVPSEQAWQVSIFAAPHTLDRSCHHQKAEMCLRFVQRTEDS